VKARAKAPAKARPKAPVKKAAVQRRAAPPKRKAAPAPAATRRGIRLTAAYGDCWLSVRQGSPTGRLLFEGTLVKGHALTYGAPRIWVRFGGASNMTVFVNGKQARHLTGTIDAVVDGSGIHAP
jgi:hypothetical protein